jgi:hypothetical protein
MFNEIIMMIGVLGGIGYFLFVCFIVGFILWLLFEFAGFIIKTVWFGFCFFVLMGLLAWIIS